MSDPQVALLLQELSQGLGTAAQGAGSIKSLKDTADGPDAAIERLINPGVKATRCLREHSSAGSTETQHVTESLDFIVTLAPQDRAAISRAAFKTAG